MICHMHGEHFTVYPAGYVPYSRQAVARVDVSGNAFEEDFEQPPVDRWSSTYWKDLIGLSNNDENAPAREARSRREVLKPRAEALGFEVDKRTAERIAMVLEIPGFNHELARRLYTEGCRDSVLTVLESLPTGEDALPRILTAGYLVGRWGHPRFCDHYAQWLAFRLIGTWTPLHREQGVTSPQRNLATSKKQARCKQGIPARDPPRVRRRGSQTPR